MAEHPPAFRDFGILPDGLQPPPERVRCFFSRGRIVGQYLGTGLVSGMGLGLTLLVALTMPLPLSLLGCAAALAGFGAFVYLATHDVYRWVELEGNTLRARHLYTRSTIERPVEEIESLNTLVYPETSAESVVLRSLLGRVKAIEIRFRDRRTPLCIQRADPAMTNAKELIEAVVYRMSRVRGIDAEVVDSDGHPLVRNIHWKGERPITPPANTLKVCLCTLMGMALLLGTIGVYAGFEEQERHLIGSVPPQEIDLRALAQNGPGTNRHVTVTGFRPGGYAAESKSGSWTEVWIALFATTAHPDDPQQIKVVLISKAVRDAAALGRLLQHGRVTGICSKAPRSSLGRVVGPKLVEVNQGWPLSSAWTITEMRDPPSAALVTGILTASAAGLAATILLALILFFWKAA